MLKNYLITAIRNFRHNKIFTLINVLGLSVGISAALVIYLIVRYDSSFERSQKDGDRIYRVISDMKFAGEPFHNAGVPDPLPDAADKELTGLEGSAAFYQYTPKVTIHTAGQTKPGIFKAQQAIVFADEHYFKLFSFYDWLIGSPQTSLIAPFHVVLTESRAKTYFPGSDPARAIGHTIVYDDSITATVTGILKDPTVITDFNFKEFISRSTMYNGGLKESLGVISCLGLLGLVIYSTNLRIKEIGVRKVLGASVAQIVSILSKDFVKLVAIAFLVAVPIAWWASRKWLESLAYRATIGWWVFPASGLAMVILALLIMGIRTVRAANANQVNSLRSE